MTWGGRHGGQRIRFSLQPGHHRKEGQSEEEHRLEFSGLYPQDAVDYRPDRLHGMRQSRIRREG